MTNATSHSFDTFRAALLAVFLAAAAMVHPSPGTTDEYRWGVAAGADFAALLNKPVVTEMEAEPWKDPASGESRIAGWSEVHGVFDVPFEAMVRILTDYEGQPRYSPRLFKARVEGRDGPRIKVFQEVGMSILGIKVKYDVHIEFQEERLADGGFGQRSWLLSNPNGTLYESFSSWYVLPVRVDGRDYVYVRGFSRPGLRKPFPGMAGALRTFTPGEVKSLLEIYVKEGRKLAIAGL